MTRIGGVKWLKRSPSSHRVFKTFRGSSRSLWKDSSMHRCSKLRPLKIRAIRKIKGKSHYSSQLPNWGQSSKQMRSQSRSSGSKTRPFRRSPLRGHSSAACAASLAPLRIAQHLWQMHQRTSSANRPCWDRLQRRLPMLKCN